MADTFDGEVLNLDFTGVEEPGPIAPGLYPARIQEVDVHNSESSGLPCIYLTLELLGPAKYAGRTAQYTISLSERSKPFMKRDLRALGIPEAQLVGRLRLRPRDLDGRTCVVRITNQAGTDGEIRYRATRVFAPTHATTAMVSEGEDTGAPYGSVEDTLDFEDATDLEETVF